MHIDARIRPRSQKFMYERFHNMATDYYYNGKLTFKNCIILYLCKDTSPRKMSESFSLWLSAQMEIKIKG